MRAQEGSVQRGRISRVACGWVPSDASWQTCRDPGALQGATCVLSDLDPSSMIAWYSGDRAHGGAAGPKVATGQEHVRPFDT